MTRHTRSRWQRIAALPVTALLLAAAACSKVTPNTTLTPHSEFGRDIDKLFYLILVLGAIIFVLVEAALLITVFKWRRRANAPEPKQVHGNTALEISWTLIPAIILAVIAVPTVRTIFKTQAPAPANSLQVEVYGHQWWWEFRYPQLGIVTANELYLPVGRTINFKLQTKDVLHSFWIPELAGKRDLISNHTNYLWFTPESAYVWNGFCAEYCGASHANMRFKVFTVAQADFDAWATHQKTGPALTAPAVPANPTAAKMAPPASTSPLAQVQRQDTAPGAPGVPAPATVAATPPAPAGANWDASTATFARTSLPAHVVPSTPIPEGARVTAPLGDPMRGAALYKQAACIGCHQITGVSAGIIGPNLTHVGSRTTIAGAMYPNDAPHLMAWLKDAPLMKPGSIMPAMGKGIPKAMGAFTDQQIADVAAYLLSLK